jgi:hypothetical protein
VGTKRTPIGLAPGRAFSERAKRLFIHINAREAGGLERRSSEWLVLTKELHGLLGRSPWEPNICDAADGAAPWPIGSLDPKASDTASEAEAKERGRAEWIAAAALRQALARAAET